MKKPTISRPSQHHVVVIGAGYAGVMAANRLATSPALPGLHVTLVNSSADFVERIRLHEYAAGSRTDATHPLSSVLNDRIRLLSDTVVTITPGAREVVTARGATLAYDALIYAPGSGAATPPPGMRNVHTNEAAAQLNSGLSKLATGSHVAVVGGGLTGIETAAECAQQHPELSVSLVTRGDLAPSVGNAARARLHSGLNKLGVTVREHHCLPVEGDILTALGADEVIWSTGFSFPTLAADSGLQVDEANRLVVDESLRSLTESAVFGAGDAVTISAPGYEHVRAGCASAQPMGAHAADSVLAMLVDESPEPLSFGYVMQSISVGRNAGVIQLVNPIDVPRKAHLHGSLGAFTKETICTMTMKWMREEGRKHRSYSWPRGTTIQPTADTKVDSQR